MKGGSLHLAYVFLKILAMLYVTLIISVKESVAKNRLIVKVRQ